LAGGNSVHALTRPAHLPPCDDTGRGGGDQAGHEVVQRQTICPQELKQRSP
jgi:hypothetical protein